MSIPLTEQQRRQLTHARESAGLSKPDLAALCGVSRPMVAMVESGKKRPSRELLDRMAGELGLQAEVRLVVRLKKVSQKS